MKNILIKGFSIFTWAYASLLGGMFLYGALNSILNFCEGLLIPCLVWGGISYLGLYLINKSTKVKNLIDYIVNQPEDKF